MKVQSRLLTPEEMAVFSRSCEALHTEAVVREYANRWVAAYDGEIVACSRSRDVVIRKIARAGVSEDLAAIRFVEPEQVCLVL